jgi:hypothetical protein
MSRAAPAVAVAVLALTAGCGGFLGDATPDRARYDVPTTTTTAGGATGESSPGPMGERVPSNGYRPSATADLPGVLSAHERRVRSAGNVTIRRTETITSGGTTVGRSFTYRVDFDRDRHRIHLVETGETNRTETAYATGETTYRRTVRGGGAPEFGTDEDGETVGTVPVRAVQELLVNRGLVADLTPDGTATVDGERVRRYTAHTLPAETRRNFRSITRFSLTVLVDDDGVVREFEYAIRARTAAGERYVEFSRLTVSGVGNTTVTPPAWVGNRTTPP